MNIPKDKVMHFGAGLAGALVVGFVISPQVGFAFGVCIGIGKEVYDRVSGKGTPEFLDFVATVVGAMFGAGFAA